MRKSEGLRAEGLEAGSTPAARGGLRSFDLARTRKRSRFFNHGRGKRGVAAAIGCSYRVLSSDNNLVWIFPRSVTP